MDPWSIGVDRALGSLSSGVEWGNAAMIQWGIDRLTSRCGESESLAPAVPMLFAEAVQDGFARSMARAVEASSRKSFAPLDRFEAYENACLFLAIAASQDEWGKLFVEETVSFMSISAARSMPYVSALNQPGEKDFAQPASSYFAALCLHEKLRMALEVPEEISARVGGMVDSSGAASGESVWTKVGLFSQLEDTVDHEATSAALEAFAREQSPTSRAAAAPNRARRA